jgi:hypothetical protein
MKTTEEILAIIEECFNDLYVVNWHGNLNREVLGKEKFLKKVREKLFEPEEPEKIVIIGDEKFIGVSKEDCRGCYFDKGILCHMPYDSLVNCDSISREDKRSVIFKKVE